MKRFFHTIVRFIVLLLILAILGIIFLPQTAVQFFPESAKNNIRTSLGTTCAIEEKTPTIDYTQQLEALDEKLDTIIEKINLIETNNIEEETKKTEPQQQETEPTSPTKETTKKPSDQENDEVEGEEKSS